MKTTMIVTAVLGVALLTLGACVTTKQAQMLQSQTNGVHQNAPAWFQEYWQGYLQKAGPQALALALDGSSAQYYYCAGGPSVCAALSSSVGLAIAKCQQGSKTGSRCALYAKKRSIVWAHPSPWGAAALAHQDTPAVTKAEPKRGGEPRTYTLSYVGSTDVYRGTMMLQQRVGGGRMYGSFAGRDCEGRFRFTSGRRGKWEFNCDNGEFSASGDFTATGDRNGGSRGTGVDNEGRMVEFIVDPAGGV